MEFGWIWIICIFICLIISLIGFIMSAVALRKIDEYHSEEDKTDKTE